MVGRAVSRFGTRRVQLRGRRARDPSSRTITSCASRRRTTRQTWSAPVRFARPLQAFAYSATALRRHSGQLTMGSAMDAPYLDPSRGRRDKAGLFVRGARLLGLVMFVSGVILGCYVGLHWLQTGRVEAMLLEDVVFTKLPDSAQAWVVHPRSWYGLHRFVVWVLRIPLFASVAFSGFLILLASATRVGNRVA